jgi:hypothetical protein
MYCPASGFAVRVTPKVHPAAVEEWPEIADLQHLHASFIHVKKVPFKIQYLDAVPAAGQ